MKAALSIALLATGLAAGCGGQGVSGLDTDEERARVESSIEVDYAKQSRGQGLKVGSATCMDVDGESGLQCILRVRSKYGGPTAQIPIDVSFASDGSSFTWRTAR